MLITCFKITLNKFLKIRNIKYTSKILLNATKKAMQKIMEIIVLQNIKLVDPALEIKVDTKIYTKANNKKALGNKMKT